MTGFFVFLLVLGIFGTAMIAITVVAIIRAAQNGDTGWIVAICVGWVVGFGWLVGIVYLVSGPSGRNRSLGAGYAQLAPPGGQPPAAWHKDPTERYDLRYWDGTRWTEHVSRAGTQATDPL